MSFHHGKLLAGTAVALLTCVGTIAPAFARPLSQANEGQLLSQVNRPEREGVPTANVETVSGRVVGISGDQVQLRLSNNETRTYTIPQESQQQYNLQTGSDVTLSVTRGTNTVVAINPVNRAGDPTTTVGATENTTGSTTGTTGSTTTSGSSTVIRRETTVTQQQQTPAPRPTTQTPAPRPAPTQTPVRALW
ncbi:MAG TPA: hypothetical protein V6D10_20250 [Trichocoleus sp.]|jgi:antitoxin component of MazEF toxin-antitoxin module